EEREAHRRIFGLIARDELAFGLGEVERRACRFGERRDEEEYREREEEQVEAEGVDEPEPVPDLSLDDLVKVETVGEEHDPDEDEPDRDLIADHLRRS